MKDTALATATEHASEAEAGQHTRTETGTCLKAIGACPAHAVYKVWELMRPHDKTLIAAVRGQAGE